MRNFLAAVIGLALFLCVDAAQAWNQFGHMLVAAIAYADIQTTPALKAKVDALVKLNPQYASWVAGAAPQQRDEIAFLMASHWPDAIKHDDRYHDDGKDHGETPVEPEASQNTGYADLARHKYWHYKDVGFSTDGSKVEPAQVPNVETVIMRFRSTLGSPTASATVKSYDLSWLIHLVGDAHQPLHATSRFTADLPHGDSGGNKVALCVAPCRDELHAYWDDVLGNDSAATAAIHRAAKMAASGPAALPAKARITRVASWIDESVSAARASAYVAPVGAAGRGPYTLDAAYHERARAVAEERAALAGARLARLIRTALK